MKVVRPTYAYVCCPCTASAKALISCVVDAVKDP